jgi:trimeric autotransporter adhesin
MNRYLPSLVLLSAAALAVSAGQAHAQLCADWDTSFGFPGATGEPTANQPTVWEPWIRTFTTHDLGNGPMLFAAGMFSHIGGVPARHVGMSADGGLSWQAMGSGLFHDGNTLSWSQVWTSAGFGNSVYFGGMFTDAGGIFASRIARWDGELWHTVGGGLGGAIGPTLIEARAMTTWDDGRGEALYVGGRFPTAGGITVNNIARWDGANWEPLGSGMTSVGGSGQDVYALAVFQNKLYAGGWFVRAGGVDASRIASWDGTSWSALPGPQINSDVNDLVVFDDGTGEALYAVGWFTRAGTPAVVTLNGVGKFDGNTWHALGNGVITDTFLHVVLAAAVIDDGNGPALHVGGYLPHLANLARFNGATWDTVGGGIWGGDPEIVAELQAYENRLHVGGQFAFAGANPASSMARWGCPIDPDPCYANCDGSTVEPVLNVEDFTCFVNEFAVALTLPPAQQLTHYANCDQSTTEPILNVEDFICFITEFAEGCP